MTKENSSIEPDLDAAASNAEDTHEEKKRYWPLWLLAILLLIGGAAAATYPKWKSHLENLKDLFPQNTVALSEKKTTVKAVPDVQKKTSVRPAKEDPSINAMQAALADISASLQQLRDQSDHVIASNAEVQQSMGKMSGMLKSTPSLALKSRLFVAAHTQSRWIDRYFAWSDIASMPSLSTDKLEIAASLRNQSQHLWEQQQQWLYELRQTTLKLNTLAPTLQSSTHASNSVRDWLNQNVQVRQAPLNQRDIQKSVQDIEKMIILIDQPAWPDTRQWTELLAHIQLIIPEASWPAIPDSFDAIQSQAETIRLTAENWIKE